MDMLKIEGLCKGFGDKPVLRGLDLTVPEGSIFGFIGKNGSGKTTTMKLVLGLLAADSGQITVNGETVTFGQTPTNRFLGYLPDVPEFYPFMTAMEYLQFCGNISGMGKEDCRLRSRQLLHLVGLAEEHHRIQGFSRGLKQRLGIAQALLNRPKLLICDEPTSALDPVGRKEILDILLAVRQETTVLFSTHILSDVERICTDVAFLRDGIVGVQGKLADIKQQYRRREFYVETTHPGDAARFLPFFPHARQEAGRIFFPEHQHEIFDVMTFAGQNRIPVTRLEYPEPSLETLFMEVTGT